LRSGFKRRLRPSTIRRYIVRPYLPLRVATRKML
jgi:hypothetical protein